VRRTALLEAIDPVDDREAQRIASSAAFDLLLREIITLDRQDTRLPEPGAVAIRLSSPSRVPRWSAAVAVAAAVVLLTALLVTGGSGNSGKAPIAAQKAGTWTLADDVLSGTWQQYTNGPPPGLLSCPTTTICYAMAGKYASPAAGSPMLSESVYVSTDAGATWAERPMPQGFASTSPISCSSSSDCAAGGTQEGRAVLASTTDGGANWAITPLPTRVGHLDTLSCPTTSFCAGLAADSEVLQIGKTDATFLATSNGGQTFTDTPIVPGQSMQSLACTSAVDCTAIGWDDAVGSNDLTAGVAARTTDGGRTWSRGVLPRGLGVSYLSNLSCADASHCMMSGTIAISLPIPPQCTNLHLGGGTAGNVPTDPQIPAVAAIAREESEAASHEVLKQAASGKSFSCGAPGQPFFVGALASTQDGGLTWTPDHLPSGVPEPQFSDLSCPTVNQCWATGEDALPRQVGNSYNGGSPMLLATTDGGSTWSSVTFSVPQGAPNFDDQSYLSMGGISCPSTNLCVALGTGAQSAQTVPTYSLVVPSS
jgi:photosystem II stability/assembly factor-like uncharacterized protein